MVSQIAISDQSSSQRRPGVRMLARHGICAVGKVLVASAGAVGGIIAAGGAVLAGVAAERASGMEDVKVALITSLVGVGTVGAAAFVGHSLNENRAHRLAERLDRWRNAGHQAPTL